MKRILALGLSTLLAAAAAPAAHAAAPAAAAPAAHAAAPAAAAPAAVAVPSLRVMPLGDSITAGAGSATGSSYRAPL
ncbi:hypothetical protein AB0F71_18400 [Kitasatospora sp. NPDC028055]|uniref:hypothetical protein n=1 Tax=Kitasatospora sp. NPDC028055 TaxID=3155653 RepID=UPI0033C5ECFB